jgi:predicted transcriptional regulator
MKSLRLRLDDDLLARLDASEEVQQRGRSEVLRKAAAEYIGRCCQVSEASEAIAEQYRRAYENGAGIGEEFEGWEDQGAWPSE